LIRKTISSPTFSAKGLDVKKQFAKEQGIAASRHTKAGPVAKSLPVLP
jgi:hypothetical protein